MTDHGQVYNDPNRNLSYYHPENRAVSEFRYLGWDVPPDQLQFIPEHWLTHREPPKSMHYLLALIYSAFMVASLTGNGLVIWIFMSARSLRTPSNIFVVNLAILDFLMMLKAPIFLYNSLNFGFKLGHAGCQVFAFIGSYSGIGAGMTNALIGYDRYHVITRPMNGRLSFTKARCLVALVWIYCTPWAMMPLFRIWGRFIPVNFNRTKLKSLNAIASYTRKITEDKFYKILASFLSSNFHITSTSYEVLDSEK